MTSLFNFHNGLTAFRNRKTRPTIKWLLGGCVLYDGSSKLINIKSNERCVLNDGERRLLDALIEKKRIQRQEIVELVWTYKGVVVSHSSYYKLLSLLRKKFKFLFGDAAGDVFNVISKYGVELNCKVEVYQPHGRRFGLMFMLFFVVAYVLLCVFVFKEEICSYLLHLRCS